MNFSALFLCLTLLAVTTGCSSRKPLDARGPDENAVMSKPPLSLPPDFTLRAPEPENKNALPQTPAPDSLLSAQDGGEPAPAQAPQAAPDTQESVLSDGERALLNETPNSGDDDVRERLKQDEEQEGDDSLYLERKIKEWQEEAAQTLNARQEAEKLRDQGVKTPQTPDSEKETP